MYQLPLATAALFLATQIFAGSIFDGPVLGAPGGVEQSVRNIFEYSNIYDPIIYLDICSYHFLFTNIYHIICPPIP